MQPDEDDVSITYSVRELLSDIKTQLTEIKTILGSKADQVQLDLLAKRVVNLERITWAGAGIGAIAGAALWLHQIGLLQF